MSSNQTVYHNKYNMYNAYMCNLYNTYVYSIMIGIAELNTFSCVENKQKLKSKHIIKKHFNHTKIRKETRELLLLLGHSDINQIGMFTSLDYSLDLYQDLLTFINWTCLHYHKLHLFII